MLLDYNFQSAYYGVFSSNHPELANNFFPVIEKAAEIGRRRAAYPHWGDRGLGHSGPAGMILSSWQPVGIAGLDLGNFSGIELPSHISPYGGYYMGDLGTRGLIGWCALVFIDRVDYVSDLEFLRTKAYPILLEAADFYESYLTKHNNGSLSLENTCALESCTTPANRKKNGQPQRNVAMTLGWIRATFSALLRFSEQLGCDASRRPTWANIVRWPYVFCSILLFTAV